MYAAIYIQKVKRTLMNNTQKIATSFIGVKKKERMKKKTVKHFSLVGFEHFHT